MTDSRSDALQYAQQNTLKVLDELYELLRIPSISTSPECKEDVRRAAEWVAAKLASLGMENVQLFPTERHPVVFGEYNQAGPNAPTVLVYGHYDVQPVEPLELWQSGAFEPTVRGENLYARGASDMKGQIMAVLAAIEAIMRTGSFPTNLKFLIEGEEEIGSPHLKGVISSHKDLLASDFALNPDSGMLAPDQPTITYALRGLAYFELHISGPDHDLHSGIFGGIVNNPAQVLCELIAGMHDERGRITLPGFYDKVRKLDDEERAALARLPVGDEVYIKQTGVPALWGEEGYTSVERLGARPTLEVNGLLSGYTGEGSKTVLPATAMAKISCRLVPDQDPADVNRQLIQYLDAHTPKTVRYEVVQLAGGAASISDRYSPGVVAMSKALETVWGKQPLFRREGGSVPVVAQFQQILGIEAVNCGFGLPDDNYHSPNEKLHLPTWRKGIEACIHFYYNLR